MEGQSKVISECGGAGDSASARDQYQGEALLAWQFDILPALRIIFQTVYPVRRSVVLGDTPMIERSDRTMTQAYCVKCRKKVEIKSPKQVTLKNKRPATSGTCPVCGTKVFRLGKA